eukprot:CCRYP_012630-RA/>CCRYP_012630-RA protein AED:0.44 eAED:0.44 QI:0/0/0/1/0/0/2/0/137
MHHISVNPKHAVEPGVTSFSPRNTMTHTQTTVQYTMSQQSLKLTNATHARKTGPPAQGKTPIQTNNSTAHGVVNGKIQPKQTKAMDMRFYWLKDRDTQNFFQFHWKPGKNNLADYWTKHHEAIHHSNIRSQILSPDQ